MLLLFLGGGSEVTRLTAVQTPPRAVIYGLGHADTAVFSFARQLSGMPFINAYPHITLKSWLHLFTSDFLAKDTDQPEAEDLILK